MKLIIPKHDDRFYHHIEKWEKGHRIRTILGRFFFIPLGAEITENNFEFIIELNPDQVFLYQWKEQTLAEFKNNNINSYDGYKEYRIYD